MTEHTPAKDHDTTPKVDPDVVSDPAKDDSQDGDWSGEGGATPSGAATNSGPDEEEPSHS